MMSWLEMRLMMLDVGKRFYKRIEIYTSVYIFCYSIEAIVGLAYYFGFIKINFELGTLIAFVVELVVILLALFKLIILGSMINQETMNQIHRIVEL